MTPLVELVDIKKIFKVKSSFFSNRPKSLTAVNGVSFDIIQGECLGLVGESGCGKSTLGRMLVRLEKPTDGKIIFEGADLSKMSRREMTKFRQRVQMIFQDPYSSLNPRKTIGSTIGEPLQIHNVGKGAARREKVASLMAEVGLRPEHFGRYPHEFSGGQRQRVGIARALALNPDLIIADEPVSALDVSIQAQVINLLKELQAKFNLTYLFIAHDLSLVRHVSDRIAVMYLGKIVEMVPKARFGQPDHHPYTLALLESIPVANPKGRKIVPLAGDVPSPIDPPPGCTFHPRCREKISICEEAAPTLKEFGPSHLMACHRR